MTDPDAAVSPSAALRNLLFADLAPAWAREVFTRGGEATRYIVELAAAAEAGDAPAALRAIAVAPAPERETRLFLQAWHLARLAGIDPGSSAHRALGVVVDMHTDDGLDTLAGFRDGSARYLNYSGAGVVWEAPDPEIGRLVDDLLLRAEEVVAVTGPLDGDRPAPPGHGGAMISVLTPGGIHVGAGSVYALSNDSRGGPVIHAAAALLGELVTRAQASDRTSSP
jgi:hypothetical protein